MPSGSREIISAHQIKGKVVVKADDGTGAGGKRKAKGPAPVTVDQDVTDGPSDARGDVINWYANNWSRQRAHRRARSRPPCNGKFKKRGHQFVPLENERQARHAHLGHTPQSHTEQWESHHYGGGDHHVGSRGRSRE